jgi:hypothetical protein
MGKKDLAAVDMKRSKDMNYRPAEEHRLPEIID